MKYDYKVMKTLKESMQQLRVLRGELDQLSNKMKKINQIEGQLVDVVTKIEEVKNIVKP